MRPWILLACAILSEVSATLALRGATEQPGWIALVVAGYATSFACMSAALRAGLAIGVAYAIWSAVGVVATAALAVPLFGDRLTWLMAAGFALIVGGVVLVESGSRPAPDPS